MTQAMCAIGFSALRLPILLALVTLLNCYKASAHGTGPTYLTIEESTSSSLLMLRLEIPMGDLEMVVTLNFDDALTTNPEVVGSMQSSMAALVRKNIVVTRGGGPCTLHIQSLGATKRQTEPFVLVQEEIRCIKDGPLALSTRLFFGHEAYTVLLQANVKGHRHAAVLSPSIFSWTESQVLQSNWKTVANFLEQGIFHVLIGYDHLAFLILLLLPSILKGTESGWNAILSRREIARDLLKIITTFTVAHSMTLGLAATNTVHLPARPVEAGIAASIMIAGVMNLFPIAAHWRWWIALGFGLVHGFGFANALAEIDIRGGRLIPILLGFNVGVELAQLAIIVATLPMLLAIRRFPFYSQRLMPGLSILLAAMGAVWFWARI